MDEELQTLWRKTRVSPDEEELKVHFDRVLERHGLATRPRLRHALIDCFVQYLAKRPLDVLVEVDQDTPLSMIQVILNDMLLELASSLDFAFMPDGKRALVKGRTFDLAHNDRLEVCCYGPLGVKRREIRVQDPRIVDPPPPRVRRVCNDCEEEIDHLGDCFCTIGLCPPCPSCNGSGIDHRSVVEAEPCNDCGAGGTIGAYNQRQAWLLRD